MQCMCWRHSLCRINGRSSHKRAMLTRWRGGDQYGVAGCDDSLRDLRFPFNITSGSHSWAICDTRADRHGKSVVMCDITSLQSDSQHLSALGTRTSNPPNNASGVQSLQRKAKQRTRQRVAHCCDTIPLVADSTPASLRECCSFMENLYICNISTVILFY